MMVHRTTQVCVSPVTYERLHIVMQVRAGQDRARLVRAHFRGCTAVIEDR